MEKSLSFKAKQGKARKIPARKFWIPVIVVLLAAAAGLGYFFWKQPGTQAVTETTTMYTAQVEKGSILLSVTGAGTLSPGQ